MATTSGPAGIAMGSVGSLLERQDFSPEELRAALAGSRGSRQPDGLLRKGLGQREFFSYLHLPKKDGKTTKRAPRNEPDYATLYYRELLGLVTSARLPCLSGVALTRCICVSGDWAQLRDCDAGVVSWEALTVGWGRLRCGKSEA